MFDIQRSTGKEFSFIWPSRNNYQRRPTTYCLNIEFVPGSSWSPFCAGILTHANSLGHGLGFRDNSLLEVANRSYMSRHPPPNYHRPRPNFKAYLLACGSPWRSVPGLMTYLGPVSSRAVAGGDPSMGLDRFFSPPRPTICARFRVLGPGVPYRNVLRRSNTFLPDYPAAAFRV